MKRIIVVLIAGLAVLGIVATFVLPVFLPMAIIGYDGPVASIVGIDHTYDDVGLEGTIVEQVYPTDAYLYPDLPDIGDLIVPTGLRAEIMAALNIIDTVALEPIIRSDSEEVDTGTVDGVDYVDYEITNTTWEVSRIECQMSVTVYTYNGGLKDIHGDVIFWIQIENNPFSIFSTADESFAFFVNTYTRDKAVITGDMNVVPTSSGFDFDSVSVVMDSTRVPQWIIDSGYTTNAELFTTIKFPLKILSAKPYLGLVPFVDLGVRYESTATWDIGVDVILIGVWEQVKTTRVWESGAITPGGLFDWFFELLAAIGAFLWVGIGLVGTIFIIMKVKKPMFVGVGLLILWGIILWQLGVFNVIWEGLE